jgi:hypothetical protein
MSKRTIVMVEDDLDGKVLPEEEAETFAFAVGSERYELDVSKENADKLRTEFGKYVSKARNVTRLGGGTTTTRRSTSRPASRNTESHAIREWAVKEGLMDAGKRGRLPAEVVEKYTMRNMSKQPPLPSPKAPESSTPKAPAKGSQSPSENTAPASTGKDKVKATA